MKDNTTNKKLNEKMQVDNVELGGELTEEEQDDLEEALIGRVRARRDGASQTDILVNPPSSGEILTTSPQQILDQNNAIDSPPTVTRRFTMRNLFKTTPQHAHDDDSSSEDSLVNALDKSKASLFKKMSPLYNTLKKKHPNRSKPSNGSYKAPTQLLKRKNKKSSKESAATVSKNSHVNKAASKNLAYPKKSSNVSPLLMKQSRIKDSSNKKERGVTRNEHNFFVSKKQQEEEEEIDLTNVLLESVSHGHRITRDTIEEGFQWGDFLDTPPAQQTSPPTRTINSPPPIVTRSSIQLGE
eukprot:scaffold25446_cov38-Attheya_sp.AAC.1